MSKHYLGQLIVIQKSDGWGPSLSRSYKILHFVQDDRSYYLVNPSKNFTLTGICASINSGALSSSI